MPIIKAFIKPFILLSFGIVLLVWVGVEVDGGGEYPILNILLIMFKVIPFIITLYKLALRHNLIHLF